MAILALMRGTLDNVAMLGLASALTGPVARGDVDTVRHHQSRLAESERALYSAMGRETLRLARDAGLAADLADELAAILDRD
jgi:predicted short-subunit dehydrogenase-like oxidoreductase (DUF2520 family)